MFAGLNLLRVGAMNKIGLKEFEFSQNYTMFWDKLERANYFFEAIIETADRDVDDRTVAFLLESAAGDGGQWNMFVTLVNKHGLVPKALMPETQSSSNTAPDERGPAQPAARGRADRPRGRWPSGVDAARAAKDEILQVIYRILCIHLGTPPERFDWQWTDKDKQFHRDGELTPQEFAAKYVDLPLDDYVCLVHDPRPTSPFGRTFTVEYLGNVVGGPPVTYLNVDMQLMKEIAAATHRRRRAGLVRLRRRQDDAPRPRHLGRRPLRPAVASTTRRSTSTRPRASTTTRRDDARDALHRRRRGRRRDRGAGGWRTAGAPTAARRASTR